MKTKVKKALIIILCILLIIAILASAFVVYINANLIKDTEIQEFNTNDTSFKVAVISDTQLPPTEEDLKNDDTYLKNFKNALTVIKNNDADMIMFAGDIGDLGTRFAFQTYVDAIDDVFGDDKPIVQTVMGNHDFWNKNAKTAINHIKAFEEIMGQSPWTHYVANGYHFIGASPNYGSMTAGYKITAKWLDKELEKASADSDGKPIFVMTHNQPFDTCYGSDEWGDSTLNDVLSKYPNVVSFSGHSHYSVLDERTIWQGEYTVISTQSLSYTELETGKENGTIPPNADKTPMGYIMEFKDDEIIIHRMNFADGNMGYEEKSDMPWTLSLPYTNDQKYSFDSRKAVNTAPVINSTSGTASTADDKITLTFEAGEDDDFVHSYKVVVDGSEEKYFFSDFYNGIENMSKTVTLELENDGKSHSYKIYAVDSWGAESEDYISIDS
ncbi:MAG: metallophosphoesterase [Eubacteriales bacterium]|nr:metallophosphoesterase [Eubacteriales bacterium]